MCVCNQNMHTVSDCGQFVRSPISGAMDYVCTRPEGHEGPCVACIRTANQHNLTGVEIDG